MPRILWFALGALAGTAYASRVIEVARLSNEPMSLERDVPTAKSLRTRLAEQIEAGAIRISGLIEERAHDFADSLRTQPAVEPAPYPPVGPRPVREPMTANTTPANTWDKPTSHLLPNEKHTPVATVHIANDLPVYDPEASSHDVLSTPFVQTDPSKPAQKIL